MPNPLPRAALLAALPFALPVLVPARASAQGGATVKVVDVPPTAGRTSLYRGNRAPLLPTPLVELPLGAVRPEGWVRAQLTRMADGFTGRLEEISPWCKFEGSAWASPDGKGQYGWEELPYWLKGFTDLAYVLQDQRLIARARRWLDAILASQRPDGYFGPEANRAAPDLWPNMPALAALRSYHDATRDPRVLRFMQRYFRWQAALPLERFLPVDWQKTRGGDNLESIIWLYNRTGDRWLLELARVNHERTADWVGGVPRWHGVDFAQCFREPGQYYQQTRDRRYLAATERDYRLMREAYGQVPGGMYGADENARPGYTGPRQGTETCAFVEMMHSCEDLLRITGDGVWADRCEDVAFNSLPPSMTPDLKGLHYLTAPNQVQLDRQSKSPMIQNGGDMFSYDPHSYRCCQHNVAFGWPYYAKRLWMATAADGLAAAFYAPCSVTAKVGDGAAVRITEETGYPFGDTIVFTIEPARPVRFPLALRIPGWCDRPEVRVNGSAAAVPSPAKGWLMLDREWRGGDRVDLRLPMPIRVTRWERNRNTASVSRGPLTYSLRVGERWQRYGSDPAWPNYEVFPTTPWNYGLVLDGADPASSFQVVEKAMPADGQPFALDAAPVELRARARRIPEWKLESNGLIGEVQPSPVRSAEPIETVALVPMGCARLRVSAFPVVGEGPDAREWADMVVDVTASFVHDALSALNDGQLPQNSTDLHVPRFTWWDHAGTAEWVQYSWVRARRLSSCQVYWFDDEVSGGQCRTPASWRLLWWDGAAWQPVANPSGYGTEKDRMVSVTFDPVQTTRLRLEAQLRPGLSGGILEWKAE